MANETNNTYISEEAFLENAKKAYEEIADILRKHKLILESDEGQGIYFTDYNLSYQVDVDVTFTDFDVWK